MMHISNILSDQTDDYFADSTLGDTGMRQANASAQPQTDNTAEFSYAERGKEHSASRLPEKEMDRERMRTMIFSMKDQLDAILRLLNGQEAPILRIPNDVENDMYILETGERIIEGVFNGEKMVGPDGKEYAVPPNYASKSKLVEGDILKLTITNGGKFIYKQIGPIERKIISGELTCDEGGRWGVAANSRFYRILKASVTFYKGESGDECFIIVPTDGEAAWGAVEQIIHSK